MKPADAATLASLYGLNPAPFSVEANTRLLDAIPEGLRLLHYTRQSIPEQYLTSFGFYHDKIGNIHLDNLPEPMQREMMFAIWRIVELGGRVPCAPLGLLVRELGATARMLRKSGKTCTSLMDRSPQEWKAELTATWARRTKELPNPNTLRTYLSPLDRACKLLWFAYDASPWWKREIWDLTMDPRIPRREQEPLRQRIVHWHLIEPPWLRLGARFYVKTLLESGQITWTSAHNIQAGFVVFAKFATQRHLNSPLLADDPSKVRPLMLEFLQETRAQPMAHGHNAGKHRSQSNLSQITTAVRGFYAFMYDHAGDAARATGDPRWSELGPEHLRFWRPGDLPRKRIKRFDERHLLSDAVVAKIAQHAHLLAAPLKEGGRGDPQAMRILLLMLATGRRISEICMLDANPLLPVEGETKASEPRIAKLRYQQTKIEGAPDTIFVDGEVIEIIAEQQRWLTEHLAAEGCHDAPKYLFVKSHNNLRGQHPYIGNVFRTQLRKLVKQTGMTDSDGQPLNLSKTHRFRHTKATKLINSGVPLHVVQRYMGHTSPEMTMHYAQTLDTTAKAEFLRYQKISHTGDQPSIPAEDLYDLMALDTRTDRILPNGWCTLPPTRSCDKGNACLTCDLFVTDERFLDVHQSELVSLDSLIDKRQQTHQQRTGEAMSENHVWLTLRRREQKALGTIVSTLQAQSSPRTPLAAPGVPARVERDRRDDQQERTGS